MKLSSVTSKTLSPYLQYLIEAIGPIITNLLQSQNHNMKVRAKDTQTGQLLPVCDVLCVFAYDMFEIVDVQSRELWSSGICVSLLLLWAMTRNQNKNTKKLTCS